MFWPCLFQLINATLTWIGMTLYQCQINKTLMKQSDLNDFLLEISKYINNVVETSLNSYILNAFLNLEILKKKIDISFFGKI